MSVRHGRSYLRRWGLGIPQTVVRSRSSAKFSPMTARLAPADNPPIMKSRYGNSRRNPRLLWRFQSRSHAGVARSGRRSGQPKRGRTEMSSCELAARQPEGPEATRLLLEHGDQADGASATGLGPRLNHAAVGHPGTVTMLLYRGAIGIWTLTPKKVTFSLCARANSHTRSRSSSTHCTTGTTPRRNQCPRA